MISDILDYQQISNGNLRLNVDEFSLSNLLEESAKLFRHETKLKGLGFYLQNNLKGRNKGGIIRSDPNRLKQIINNLLGNALKFTQAGSISVILEDYDELTLENQNKSVTNRNFRFSIKVFDTGIGINNEDLPNLFKLFGNLNFDENRNLNKYGISFGLAISQELTKALNNNLENGEIKAISEIGKGSCFYFPLASYPDGHEDENFHSFFDEAKEKSSFFINRSPEGFHNYSLEKRLQRKLNILIVDDDQTNIFVTSSYLKSYNSCFYESANDGLDAIKKIKISAQKGFYYDFILMDCNMPIMNGYEATKEIRSLVKTSLIPNVYVIACTANASQEDYKRCFKSGMNDYISKPFTKRDLISKIESFLKK